MVVGVNQCWRWIVINFTIIGGIRRPIRFTAKVLIADENTIRHANIPQILVVFDHW
jgi:hypothetical protein